MRSVAHGVQNLPRGRLAVHARVLGVVELRGAKRVGRLRGDLACLGDRALHLQLARGEHDLGAECLEQQAALEAHASRAWSGCSGSP